MPAWFCFETLISGRRAYVGKVYTSPALIAEEGKREGWVYSIEGNRITLYGIRNRSKRAK